ncbi:MAG: aldose epimerase [Alcaligenaceae bacterium]|nr:aldose epimerase [Alcaligenaceae bacterium]
MRPALVACPPDRQVRLHCGRHEAIVCAEAGGRVLRWFTGSASGRHDWLVPVDAQEWAADAWPKGGIFPLVPFSNRIRAGAFPADGRRIGLDLYPGQPHALHGFAQENAWQVVSQEADELAMEYTHQAGVRGWPWAWQARQDVRLSPGGLRLVLEVVNLSDTPMPLGLGFHPYFTAQRVSLNAATNWQHEQEMALCSQPNTVSTWDKGGETWTAFLSDWDGRAAMDWGDGTRLYMDTHGSMTHVVLHSPAGRYLCVEPVSHVCDGFNLEAAGHVGTGVRWLAPGRRTQVELDLALPAN